MPEDQSFRVALPESLRRQFARLEKRLFSLETWVAFSAALIVLFSSYFLFFVSDRFWDTPLWLRLTFTTIAGIGLVFATLWWLQRWVFKRRDLRELAVLVQRRYRRLGDRLLGIVELADELKRPPDFSPELYRAAIDQVTEEATKYDFAQAVNSRRARLDVYLTAGLLLLVLIPAALLPQASWNAFKRWIAPTAAIPRFTLVQFAGIQSEQIVPHGENFLVHAKVEYRSFWRPLAVKGLIPGQPRIAGRVNNGELILAVPGQIQDQKLQIKIGDARHQLAISPKHRPGLQKISARITLPEYLGYPEQKENLQGGALNVIEGSKFTITAESTRELMNAEMVADQSLPLNVTGQIFSTPTIPADSASHLTFQWRDTLGLTNSAPWRLAVNAQKDAPPAPEILALFRDTAVLESEVLPIETRARDDFGIKLIGLDWQAEMTESNSNAPARKDFQIATSVQTNRNLDQTFNFSPAVLRIPPDTTVEVRAYALDFLPGRERSESPVYRIHVLGNARHAEMIRQNLESLLVRLEEVTRLEERIASDTRDLKDLQKLDSPESTQRISDLQKAQEQNAAQLRELAEEGMKTLREALRNPAFTEDLLSQWTKDLHEMEQLSSKEMKEASSSLQSASQSQQSREQKLAEALSKEEEIIQKLQEMQRQVNEGLDELQALTLAQRLRKVGTEQKKIEGNLQKNIADTVGLMPQELPSRYQKVNSLLSALQLESQAESQKLQAEISRFYERTQKPNYGDVSKEMTELRPGDELDRVRGLIQENIGMEAMQNLALWADKFSGWADKLEPAGEQGSSSGGSGQGGQQDDTALKQLMALLRMREKQVNIQDRTRLLHAYLEEKLAYRDGAVLLAASQAKLNSDMTKQAVQNPYAILEQTYNDAVNVMTDVENLLDKPQTDDVTRTTQDKSVATLTDLINLLNEEAKKGQSSSSSSGESGEGDQMAFLMQMMAPQLRPGMQPGQTSGGNMSGGTTDRTGGGEQGDAAGGKTDSRSVRKASGVPQNYPTEFRPALEKYFKALEQQP